MVRKLLVAEDVSEAIAAGAGTMSDPSSRRPTASGLHERPTDDSAEAGADPVSVHLRTQFLRRIGHDIASPTGVAMTVLDELASETNRPELVAMARRGMKRLLRLSEQLALVAELESGALVPDPTVEDLNALAKDALTQATAIDGRREVTTSFEPALRNPDGGRLNVNVDRKLVVQILREVIGNALRLASSRVTIEVVLESGKAIVRVDDDGTGFPEAVLASVGERFTPQSTTRGLGLSLSMAKEIALAHGGELRLDVSTLPPGRRGGTGAAVSIAFPAA